MQFYRAFLSAHDAGLSAEPATSNSDPRAPQLLSTRFSNFPHSCAFCILYLRSTNSSCKTSFPVRAVTMSLSSPACSWQHSAHDGQGLHKPVQLCDASLIYPVYMFQAYQQKGWRVVTNLLKLCQITLR